MCAGIYKLLFKPWHLRGSINYIFFKLIPKKFGYLYKNTIFLLSSKSRNEQKDKPQHYVSKWFLPFLFLFFLGGSYYLFLSFSKLGHKSNYIANFITKGIYKLYYQDKWHHFTWLLTSRTEMESILETSVISVIPLNLHPVRFTSIIQMAAVARCFA